MYKMLVMDMDGTLLNEEQEISQENKKMLKEAMDNGIAIVLASGRHYKGMLSYIRELGLDREGCYAISCSGAVVVENGGGKVIYEEHIEPEDLRKIHRVCVSMDIDMCAYSREGFLVMHDNLFSRYDSIANKTPIIPVDFEGLREDQLAYKLNIINESPESAQEIIDYFPSIKLDSYHVRKKTVYNSKLFDELWRFPEFMRVNYNITRPLPFSIELFGKNSNKATGIEIVAGKLGISMSEVIAMGDSGNDVHMLEEAGLGVAMANARQEAKEAADLVTVSNIDHGVAKVISEYLL